MKTRTRSNYPLYVVLEVFDVDEDRTDGGGSVGFRAYELYDGQIVECSDKYDTAAEVHEEMRR